MRPRGGCGRSGDGLLHGLVLPDLLATLDDVLRLLECPRVDQVSDVVRQLAEEEDGPGLLHRGRLQGGEVVPHDRGPCIAAHRIIQPSTRHLGGAEAVAAQEELLQLLVWVADGSGVPGQRVDGGDQQKREFRQGPVELHERLGDFGGGEHRVDAVEPCMGRIGVKVAGQADCGGSPLLLLILWGHGWLMAIGCMYVQVGSPVWREHTW